VWTRSLLCNSKSLTTRRGHGDGQIIAPRAAFQSAQICHLQPGERSLTARHQNVSEPACGPAAANRSDLMTDRLIRITTVVAVAAVAAVAAVISYRHAYELVRSDGESGMTARLVPFTVDGLIWAASMLILDANRCHRAGWR
jgi:Protein of unknown function (DUF2637)